MWKLRAVRGKRGSITQGFILEFSGVDRADYDAVSPRLGIDSSKSQTDWPEGGLFDAANAIVAAAWREDESDRRQRGRRRLRFGRLRERGDSGWVRDRGLAGK